MCLGLCPFHELESTTLEGGMCSYKANEQMSNMEDLSTPGFKVLFDKDSKEKFLLGACCMVYLEFNIEKMDASFAFVKSEKENNDTFYK